MDTDFDHLHYHRQAFSLYVDGVANNKSQNKLYEVPTMVLGSFEKKKKKGVWHVSKIFFSLFLKE